MDTDFYYRHLRERLNPHLLHYLINSRHSICIWKLTDQNGRPVVGSITVIYDESDLLTAAWDNGLCSCSGGRRQHYHLCPDALRSYWGIRELSGLPNEATRHLTFSQTPERPFDCPHLNYVRVHMRSRDAHHQMLSRRCLLPGPFPTPQPVLNTTILKRMVLPPVFKRNMQLRVAGLEAPFLLAQMARASVGLAPLTPDQDQPLDLSSAQSDHQQV